MIHKILNWLIGSTWEERKEKERLIKWREERRKHWMAKLPDSYWIKHFGTPNPHFTELFSVYLHRKRQKMFRKRAKQSYIGELYD